MGGLGLSTLCPQGINACVFRLSMQITHSSSTPPSPCPPAPPASICPEMCPEAGREI